VCVQNTSTQTQKRQTQSQTPKNKHKNTCIRRLFHEHESFAWINDFFSVFCQPKPHAMGHPAVSMADASFGGKFDRLKGRLLHKQAIHGSSCHVLLV